MITAYASLETAVSAIKSGAFDFLAKPFTPQELKATIRKVADTLILARQARKLAEERRKVRFQFIRVLAHELKAPLNAVEGFLQIVLDKTAGDDPAVYDQMVERSVVRLRAMRKMIMDLLDLTRIESGEKVREVSEVDLRAIIDTAVETATPEARERDITIHVEAPETLTLTGDESELEIILNNLLSNAVKYNKDGGRVDLTARADEETITLQVADTGIGMAPEDAAKLFNDFVRIKNARTRNILGSGLGLSILKKLTQLYEGTIEVDSEPDRGSTFTVTLNRHAAPAAAEGDADELLGEGGEEA
jgi:signal transduction histidine kinase